MKIIQLGLTATMFALMGTSCMGNQKQSTAEAEVKDAEPVAVTSEVQDTLTSFYGTYEGVLPAADCEGIKTVLTLRNDTTYELVSEYLGSKEEQPITTSGVYEKNDSDVVVLITPSSGEKTYYKVVADGMALTDSTGVLNEGELANLYILKKKK